MSSFNMFLLPLTPPPAPTPAQYYEMSNCLNVEMHKQAEIAKRLNAICLQIIPFLAQEVSAGEGWVGGGACWYHAHPRHLQHQQQVGVALERAKNVTPPEIQALLQVCLFSFKG